MFIKSFLLQIFLAVVFMLLINFFVDNIFLSMIIYWPLSFCYLFFEGDFLKYFKGRKCKHSYKHVKISFLPTDIECVHCGVIKKHETVKEKI
jgi:hypothetical protein